MLPRTRLKIALRVCVYAFAAYLLFMAGAFVPMALFPDVPVASMIISDVVLTLAAIGFCKRLHMHMFQRVKKKEIPQSCLIVLVVAALWLLGQIIATLIYYQQGDTSYDSYQQTLGAAGVLVIIASCVFAPIAEELYYRGLVYKGLEQAMNPVVAALISTAFFTASHGTLTHVPVTVAVGLGSCVLCRTTGSIVPSIAMHMVANIGSYIVPMLAIPDVFFHIEFDTILYVIGTAILVGCLVYINPKEKSCQN